MSIFVHPSSVWQYQINYSELEHSNHIIWHHIYNIEIKSHVQSRLFPHEYHMGGRCGRRLVPTFLSQVEVDPRARTTIAISIAPQRTPPMIAAVFEPLPPGFKDAPAGRAEGQCWDETRELTVANAMAFE